MTLPTLEALGPALLQLSDQMSLVDVQEHLREVHGIDVDLDTINLAVLALEEERREAEEIEQDWSGYADEDVDG